MAAKKPAARGAGAARDIEPAAQRLADEQGLELVELVFAKEPRGMVMCVYLDKDGGITLDDCERFHRAFLPLVNDVDYDFLEVSSPGLDRPVKTMRDFEKNEGGLVDVKLFAKQDGQKAFRGLLKAMDDETVTITIGDEDAVFVRKNVAVIKPVIEFDDSELND